MGLRWRTQKEVVSGKGQFVCGAVVRARTLAVASLAQFPSAAVSALPALDAAFEGRLFWSAVASASTAASCLRHTGFATQAVCAASHQEQWQGERSRPWQRASLVLDEGMRSSGCGLGACCALPCRAARSGGGWRPLRCPLPTRRPGSASRCGAEQGACCYCGFSCPLLAPLHRSLFWLG